MESRQEACRQGQLQTAQEHTQKIKNEVRKDKETHLLQQLEEMEGSSYSWSGLKRLRKAPRLKYTKFRDKDGRKDSTKRIPPQGCRIFSTRTMEKKPG